MTPPFVIVPYPKANTLQTLIQAYFQVVFQVAVYKLVSKIMVSLWVKDQTSRNLRDDNMLPQGYIYGPSCLPLRKPAHQCHLLLRKISFLPDSDNILVYYIFLYFSFHG